MARNLAPPALALLLNACGYVGNPLPPLANVPAPVTDLTAVQLDGRIIVHFKLPTETTENVLIKSPLKLDLRIGTPPQGAFQPAGWAAQAKAVPGGDVHAGTAIYAFPAGEWTGKSVVIGARVVGSNGKESNWTTLQALPIVPPPEKPGKPDVQPTAEGFRLTWTGPLGDFRIFRKGEDEKIFTPVAEVSQNSWTDRSSEFGKRYTYQVQRIVKLGTHQEAQSEPSAESDTKLLVDTFAPAAPTGLRAAPAAGSVELSWERNTEPDLAGYRIYRAVGKGDFQKLAEVSQIPAYSDRAVESGKLYRYVVTAFDRSNNESQRSAPAEATVP